MNETGEANKVNVDVTRRQFVTTAVRVIAGTAVVAQNGLFECVHAAVPTTHVSSELCALASLSKADASLNEYVRARMAKTGICQMVYNRKIALYSLRCLHKAGLRSAANLEDLKQRRGSIVKNLRARQWTLIRDWNDGLIREYTKNYRLAMLHNTLSEEEFVRLRMQDIMLEDFWDCPDMSVETFTTLNTVGMRTMADYGTAVSLNIRPQDKAVLDHFHDLFRARFEQEKQTSTIAMMWEVLDPLRTFIQEQQDAKDTTIYF